MNTEGEYNPFILTCSSWDNKGWKITGTDIIQKPQNPINEHRNNKFKRGLLSLALSYKYELIQNMNRHSLYVENTNRSGQLKILQQTQ